jgi:hypothetical protein
MLGRSGLEEMRFLAAQLQRNFCTNARVSLFFYICRMITHECMGVDLRATAHLGQLSPKAMNIPIVSILQRDDKSGSHFVDNGWH